MAGTQAAFADIMNEHAKKIGLIGSHFTNPTGLPDPDQYMTARDLAKLAEYIIGQVPANSTKSTARPSSPGTRSGS